MGRVEKSMGCRVGDEEMWDEVAIGKAGAGIYIEESHALGGCTVHALRVSCGEHESEHESKWSPSYFFSSHESE
jgi:uncharacterized protein (UPF0179 family)